jgi:hypothetical protein
MRRGCNVETRFVLDTLRDLTSLYASTPGHDPTFVKKGQAAIQKLQRRCQTSRRSSPGRIISSKEREADEKVFRQSQAAQWLEQNGPMK